MTGIFDSGSGGLSVLREMLKVLPGEDYLYFSDNAHCPYGEKSPEYICERADEITAMMLAKGCDVVVVACNTATAAAISHLRAKFAIPFVGMEPAVKPAAALTRSGVVGVLATEGTLKGKKYHLIRNRYADNVKVVEQVGKGFVELVESACLEGPHAEAVVRESIRPLVEAGADTIVLGCTHYPFLSQTIACVASQLAPQTDFNLIDPAPAVARRFLDIRKEADASTANDGHRAGRDGSASATAPANASAAAPAPRVRLMASVPDTILQQLYQRY
ncbi:MAG: glutamate racemase, partial [Bacteroidales bacterium]|nr:glutamate racemase [Bacteroidales bacterium]